MDHLGPEPPRSAFGEYLRVLRQKAALTQGDLAERAGLTIDAIAALESGRRRHPYPHSVAALATALGLSGDERRLFVRQAAHARFSQPAANAERPLSNVPTPLTTLIGRSHDAAALRGLLVGSSSRRLVTVVGVGGVGKTALAIRVAGELASGFPDGVWLVELAPIADPVLVPKALSNVLGIADAPDMQVQLAPATVRREEYGLLLGRVSSVGHFPASLQGMRRVLGSDELARSLSAAGAAIEVHIELLRSPTTASGYRWTSPSGPPISIDMGTPCTVDVITGEQAPLSLVSRRP